MRPLYNDSIDHPCPSCGEEVEYTSGRRRCIVCRTWFHEGCGFNPFRSDGRMFCEPCFRKNPVPVVKGTALAVNEGSRTGISSLQIVVWSHLLDQDEERMSRDLGIPLAEVRRVGLVLRESKFWQDGHLCLELGDDEDPDKVGGMIMVGLILAALVADGYIERAPVDPASSALPEGGGTNDDDQSQQGQEDQP